MVSPCQPKLKFRSIQINFTKIAEDLCPLPAANKYRKVFLFFSCILVPVCKMYRVHCAAPGLGRATQTTISIIDGTPSAVITHAQQHSFYAS